MSNLREMDTHDATVISNELSSSGGNIVNLYPEGDTSNDTKRDSLALGLFGIFFFASLVLLPFLSSLESFSLVEKVFKLTMLSICLSAYMFRGLFGRIKLVAHLFPNRPSFRSSFCLLPFLAFCFLQIVPIPKGLIDSINQFSVKSYQFVNSSYAYLSVAPEDSASALTWLVCFLCIYSSFDGMGLVSITLGSKHRKRRRSEEEIDLSPQARTYDLLSEVIHTSIIRMAVVVGIVGVLHVVLQAKYLFGIFKISDGYFPSSRAHLPFPNANQLAIFLEMGLMLSFGRLMRERQLQKLVLRGDREEGFVAMISSISRQLDKQAWSVVTFLIIALSLVLTVSRAGIVLSLMGLTVVWVMRGFWPVNVIGVERGRGLRGSISMGSRKVKIRDTKRANTWIKILMPIAFIAVLYGFLGDSSINKVTQRFDNMYEQGGDASRSLLNGLSWNIFKESPLFGVGLNSWRYVAPQFSTPELSAYKLDYAHNEVFQLLSEVGILGCLLLFLPIGVVIGQGLLALKNLSLVSTKKNYILYSFLAVLLPILHSCADFPFHSPVLSLAILSAFVALVTIIRFEICFK